MEGNLASGTASAQETHSPAASFMGIAVELRLKIYGHLLIPHLTADDKKELQRDHHCCLLPRACRRGKIPQDYQITTCECSSKTIHPQILATCKQVYREAVDVLHENMEPRLMFPDTPERGLSVEDFNDSFNEQRRAKINQLLLVGSPTYMVRRKQLGPSGYMMRSNADDECRCSAPESYAKLIGASLPQLRHLRLHVETRRPLYVCPCGKDPELLPYAHLATIPTLRSVTIKMERTFYSLVGPEIIKTAMQDKAEACGRKLEVNVVEHDTW